MRFQVPQFIEVEDKIIGPLTLKQFIYLAGGAGISFILWQALPLPLAVLFIAPIAGLSLALAFYKVNERPFIRVLESGFRYVASNKLYLWRKKPSVGKAREGKAAAGKEKKTPEIFVPRLSESKLKDIAWELDVQESIYAGQKKSKNKRY